MGRRLFTFASAVSLVLCIAAAGLWARRDRDLVHYVRYRQGWRGTVMIDRGCLCMFSETWGGGQLTYRVHEWAGITYTIATTARGSIGFRSLVVPLGCFEAILGAMPLYWVWRTLNREWQRKHASPWFCNKCGYDLRASADRCPECGTPIPKAST